MRHLSRKIPLIHFNVFFQLGKTGPLCPRLHQFLVKMPKWTKFTNYSQSKIFTDTLHLTVILQAYSIITYKAFKQTSSNCKMLYVLFKHETNIYILPISNTHTISLNYIIQYLLNRNIKELQEAAYKYIQTDLKWCDSPLERKKL